jgi:hypothetical protein
MEFSSEFVFAAQIRQIYGYKNPITGCFTKSFSQYFCLVFYIVKHITITKIVFCDCR